MTTKLQRRYLHSYLTFYYEIVLRQHSKTGFHPLKQKGSGGHKRGSR